MKNLIYFSTLLCAMVFIFSCKPCPDCPECPNVIDPDVVSTLDDTISFQTFQTYRTNWNDHGKNYISDTLTQYFTMGLDDIDDFKQNASSQVVGARFYLGIQEFSNGDMAPHIMLVGINSRGDSIINSSASQYIYDFSLPCPSMCGAKSVR